jgi:hypothetical protein
LLSQASVSSTKVFVLVVLACLVLSAIAVVHADNRGAQVITLGIFATATAGFCLSFWSMTAPLARRDFG